MLRDLRITGFRSFESLSIEPLGRVNLLVGGNDAGETSVLEAVELLQGGEVAYLHRIASRRGERYVVSADGGAIPRPRDISQLFRGRSLSSGSEIRVESKAEPVRWVSVAAVDAPPPPAADDSGGGDDAGDGSGPASRAVRANSSRIEVGPRLALQFSAHRSLPSRLRISSFDGSTWELKDPFRLLRYPTDEPVSVMTTAGLGSDRLRSSWDTIVLTPEEDTVYQALRIIEPATERLAFSGRYFIDPDPDHSEGAAVMVELEGSDRPVPLESMGDGMKRLLALAIHLVRSRNGVLVVDEIDTGLHYSVLAKMWRLIPQTAIRLNVQVFATTHSKDCVEALQSMDQEHPAGADEVTVHRVDAGATASTAYSFQELKTAIEHWIEVR